MNRPAELLSDPRFYDISEGRETQRLELATDLRAYSVILRSDLVVRAPFVFEESIPRSLLGIAPAMGVTKRGACIHDALYKFGGYLKPLDSLGLVDVPDILIPVTRAQADAVYYEMILAKGRELFPPGAERSKLDSLRWMRFCALAKSRWLGVRAGGWMAWKKHRKLRP